ncbi:cyclase [Leptolyngbya sp. NK1-12]|uniref:Cyclase n=1 Tax=Leptolyngbya sp. NK1-12 TaxID=2547451 RepID=A0AA97ANM4_9CYAN|nr:SRPBCC family protein [Elainella sp. C42_A2020_010]RNJ66716.1 MAG: cyclase [Leptolyngbya sp. IPPAS B-1204]WNZ26957.1 cyclase [Leptolyngbya sp. NK1-12]
MEETVHSNPEQPQSPGDAERWSSLITGGAMVLLGLRQRSLRGALMALAGGGLVYHGAKGQQGLAEKVAETAGLDQSVRVERTVTIANKTPEELYRFWRNFENLPTFMRHLKSVTVINHTRSHWIANAPMGNSVEWDAEIITEQENRLIAWTSVEGADVDNSGFVRFQPGPQGRGTEVKVVMEYKPPAGIVGATLAKLFGEEPEQQIGDDLHRFKMLMEAGEIATTDGQPMG